MIESPSSARQPISPRTPHLDSDLLNYIVQHGIEPGDRVPALSELRAILDVSVSKLREQLEVARCLGIVSVRPRTGIRREAYDFMPSIRLGLFFALADDHTYFDAYSKVRRHLEEAFWREAVALLTDDDKAHLHELVDRAWFKLRGSPIRIPHQEHREFHMVIFSRLDNVFVQGLLEAYWEAYEAVELHAYTDYDYLSQVWEYHQRIAEAISTDDIDASLEAYRQHTGLLKNFAERDNEHSSEEDLSKS